MALDELVRQLPELVGERQWFDWDDREERVRAERQQVLGGRHHVVFRLIDEADPAKGSISYVAPLARALTGKGVGDSVEVNGHEVEIMEIAQPAPQ